MDPSRPGRSPRVSVIVAARFLPATTEQTLASLAAQGRAAEIEVILVEGSADGCMAALARHFPGTTCIAVPGGNLPALKAAAIRRARGALIAVLDPVDVAAPDWIEQILEAFVDPTVCAVGGSVLLAGTRSAGNVAAYLFEYGAFHPPIEAGDTHGDLPGNNVAYRRHALLEICGDIMKVEGFNKPFFHERIRARGGRLVIRPEMRVGHLARHAFFSFALRRFHYGRCYGAVRVRRASPAKKLLYRVFAPAVAPLLAVRQLHRAARHPGNRRLLPRAALALCGVCAFWGVGEWLGYWFGPGQSCRKLY